MEPGKNEGTLNVLTDSEKSEIRRIGLTGGLASGKSTVAKILRELGFEVVDADALARDLSEPGGQAEKAIRRRFGAITKAELRDLVFKDQIARKDLEEILHPLIQLKSEEALVQASKNTTKPFVFYEASLLIEKGREKDFDTLITVICRPELQIQRALARSLDRPFALDGDTAKGILAAQTTNEVRLKKSPFVITNDGSLEELRQHVNNLIQNLSKPCC